ncbi:hypothetical protein GQ600_11748 [Phytophthora cactorum]|nr:hypothetical protein GQ600_13612 [Phytophthora cactorum]KAF1784809.1 hypothetical protein GQ600_11748 [Phytophthora cactorum]
MGSFCSTRAAGTGPVTAAIATFATTSYRPPHSAHRRSFQTPTRGFKLDSIRVPQSHSKSTNPLDAKKQSLLAQKERLRAKMAARRRQ